MFIQMSARGVKEKLQDAPPTEAVSAAGGGIKRGNGRMERSCERSEIGKIAHVARRNSHSIASERPD